MCRMTQRSSPRRAGSGRVLLLILLALALLFMAYVLTRPSSPASEPMPTSAATFELPASEPSSDADGFQAGEIAATLSPTSGGFEAGVATTDPTIVAQPTRKPGATPRPTRTRSTVPSPTRSLRATATPDDGLPTIAFDDLPRQAQDTIRLIDSGGPFPYHQDGSVFQNRERLLPRRPSGYYREYTVITPGESDRGARRIVAGAAGELYYTADHYDSFKRVVR